MVKYLLQRKGSREKYYPEKRIKNNTQIPLQNRSNAKDCNSTIKITEGRFSLYI